MPAGRERGAGAQTMEAGVAQPAQLSTCLVSSWGHPPEAAQDRRFWLAGLREPWRMGGCQGGCRPSRRLPPQMRYWPDRHASDDRSRTIPVCQAKAGASLGPLAGARPDLCSGSDPWRPSRASRPQRRLDVIRSPFSSPVADRIALKGLAPGWPGSPGKEPAGLEATSRTGACHLARPIVSPPSALQARRMIWAASGLSTRGGQKRTAKRGLCCHGGGGCLLSCVTMTWLGPSAGRSGSRPALLRNGRKLGQSISVANMNVVCGRSGMPAVNMSGI